eukprot:TRINITY_DN16966_c5_g1_i1.p2 TRINITY_DN16966_c5_g1~~TRINITY_DN16966_c5_g1_i1.p2  ORF type:complete len:100 (-),score=4.72 TRINITY_DN16966_c5_g1_i1:37-336(-)
MTIMLFIYVEQSGGIGSENADIGSVKKKKKSGETGRTSVPLLELLFRFLLGKKKKKIINQKKKKNLQFIVFQFIFFYQLIFSFQFILSQYLYFVHVLAF